MEVVYRLLPDGAFICGDRATGVTVYSYPNSIYARMAKARPASTAVEMLECAVANLPASRHDESDARRWAILNEAGVVAA